jgi:hypothetical protein
MNNGDCHRGSPSDSQRFRRALDQAIGWATRNKSAIDH